MFISFKDIKIYTSSVSKFLMSEGLGAEIYLQNIYVSININL